MEEAPTTSPLERPWRVTIGSWVLVLWGIVSALAAAAMFPVVVGWINLDANAILQKVTTAIRLDSFMYWGYVSQVALMVITGIFAVLTGIGCLRRSIRSRDFVFVILAMHITGILIPDAMLEWRWPTLSPEIDAHFSEQDSSILKAAIGERGHGNTAIASLNQIALVLTLTLIFTSRVTRDWFMSGIGSRTPED